MPDGDGWTVDDNVRSDSGRILLWNSVRRVVRDRLGCVRNNGSQGRGPSTYEVEGPLGSAAPAAQSLSPLLSSPTSRTALSIPIARSARQSDPSVREAVRSLSQPVQRNTPTSIRQVWATHRSTRCLPPRKAPFPGATRQVVDHSRTPQPLARLRELPALMLADPGVSPEGSPLNPVTVSGGVRDLYRRHPHRARGWRSRFQDSSLVHRGSHVTPRQRHVIHRLSTGSSTHSAASTRR